jgi:predicted transcriptional regulator
LSVRAALRTPIGRCVFLWVVRWRQVSQRHFYSAARAINLGCAVNQFYEVVLETHVQTINEAKDRRPASGSGWRSARSYFLQARRGPYTG